VQGTMCSTAQADEAVYASPQTMPGCPASSPHWIVDSTSDSAQDAPPRDSVKDSLAG
jgi:hypothetical protein